MTDRNSCRMRKKPKSEEEQRLFTLNVSEILVSIGLHTFKAQPSANLSDTNEEVVKNGEIHIRMTIESIKRFRNRFGESFNCFSFTVSCLENNW